MGKENGRGSCVKRPSEAEAWLRQRGAAVTTLLLLLKQFLCSRSRDITGIEV